MPIIEENEQKNIEKIIIQLLKNLMQPNVNRLKAAITILMTNDISSSDALISKDLQRELGEFKYLLQNPNRFAPISSNTEEGKEAVLNHIKAFTLENLKILDERLSILPNSQTVSKTIQEGERLKSVIHTSALRHVVTAAHYESKLRDNLFKLNYTGDALNSLLKAASESMVRLCIAVATDDLPTVVRELKVKGVDINLPNPDGLPLLQLAVREGYKDIVEVLLKQPELDVNRVSINGWTALHFAARLGFTDIVKLLLKAPNIDINLANSDGWTALNWAAWQGTLPVVELLLNEKTIEVNKRDSSQGTPLHWAARNGQADVIALLLNVPNIEINALDIDKKTPLHYAVAFDHPPATSTLLSAPELNVNQKDVDGLTPLHWAARNGSLELVSLLLKVPNIKLDIKDNNDMLPLDWAKHNEYPELVPLLVPSKMKLPSRFSLFWKKLKLRFQQAWSRG